MWICFPAQQVASPLALLRHLVDSESQIDEDINTFLLMAL